MGLFDKLRRSSRRSSRRSNRETTDPPSPRVNVSGRDYTQQLPRPVLTRIFSFVCPHTVDNTYGTSEESASDGCMLCDMRDLAHCTLVNKRWFLNARALLYTNVRIDPVHYCELEIELAAKRKRRSFFDRNGDPIDAPQVRLEMFMRTVRDSQGLGNMVLSLRMPYMTREANKANVARTISVLPNLRFVDLPVGLYSDEPSCLPLKQELMARCPELRRMAYRQGAEGSFARLPGSQLWMNLEVLELSGVQMEASTLRNGLASFPVFSLTLRNTPNVTASGLAVFLSIPANKATLGALILSSTGVAPSQLHYILSAAPRLESLSVVQEVTRSFPVEQVPPMASKSLHLLHYELTSQPDNHGMPPVVSSYYTYLISSLVSRTLPALRDLYVRDSSFPDTLLLMPPPRLFGGGESGPQMRGGLSQPLNVYSKGLDEFEWNFTPYDPSPMAGRRDSRTRPVSFHEAQLNRSWGGDARKSVLVGNGFGGFLAVPADEERPMSSHGHQRRSSRQDIWR
ncbi:hypothetical protein N7519_006629 [Penicillium mononematosum]|uniref:uncharacterized protein n=1 Tax=Penicillium mononematosum TaxID=268346 RepID=UPI00254877B5|nr:uncharacterized protein N7519_006629 [Penicillium mononematosum]KAJ6185328.1 hypothetical protein N7519_006629 [Penicillium mononematosum]